MIVTRKFFLMYSSYPRSWPARVVQTENLKMSLLSKEVKRNCIKYLPNNFFLQTCPAKIWIKGFSVTSLAILTIVFIKFSSFLTSYCKSESLHLSLTILGLLRCLKRLLWMGWMVIIGHRSPKNTYSANKMRDNSRYH